MHVFMTFELPVKRVRLYDSHYIALLSNHYVNAFAEPRLYCFLYLINEFGLGRLLCIKGQIPAVYVTHNVLKAELGKHGLELVHFDHVAAADIYAAQQRDISHIVWQSMT